MFKRLKWILIGYVIGIFTFDILKRYLEERYGDTSAYQTFSSALSSVSDFQKSKANMEVYIETE